MIWKLKKKIVNQEDLLNQVAAVEEWSDFWEDSRNGKGIGNNSDKWKNN